MIKNDTVYRQLLRNFPQNMNCISNFLFISYRQCRISFSKLKKLKVPLINNSRNIKALIILITEDNIVENCQYITNLIFNLNKT